MSSCAQERYAHSTTLNGNASGASLAYYFTNLRIRLALGQLNHSGWLATKLQDESSILFCAVLGDATKHL
jgi:hypothetical protein